MAQLLQLVFLASMSVLAVTGIAIPDTYEKSSAVFAPHDQSKYESAATQQATSSSDSNKSASADDGVLDEAPSMEYSPVSAPQHQEKKTLSSLTTKMKSGYSKVSTAMVPPGKVADSDTPASNDVAPVALDTRPLLPEGKESSQQTGGSDGSESAEAKSLERGQESQRQQATSVPSAAAGSTAVDSTPQPDDSSLSAKASLAIFMREHLYAKSQSEDAPSSSGQQSAALTLDDDSSADDEDSSSHFPSLMQKKISEFVERYMGPVLQASIHEVRVEQRANGLQEYRQA